MLHDLLAVHTLEGTKISHNYEGHNVKTFSYRHLVDINVPSIGIPAKQNRLIIIDVDAGGAAHKHDGREWFHRFAQENQIPPTYSVSTANGGFHCYYRLPESVNPDTFSPPKELAPGVEIKWNGWVNAPPTSGYSVAYGNIGMIVDAPPALMLEIERRLKTGAPREFEFNGELLYNIHQPYTPEQIADLKARIQWLQTSGVALSYHEWRDGLFALKAGINDPELLDEMAYAWTCNAGYQPGDEHKAREIVERADKFGNVGPGTIFALLRDQMARNSALTVNTAFSLPEILERAQVPSRFNKDGKLIIEPTEANAALIMGALYDEDDLYHDIRQDLFMFRGQAYSDRDLTNLLVPVIQSSSKGLGLDKFKRAIIAGGVDVIMSMRQIDPHAKWLDTIQWDGTPRVDTFFSSYVGVEDTDYHRAVARVFWLSLAARGINPGCKFDSMLILEGNEGIAKSTLVEAIGGEYTFTPTNNRAFDDVDELRRMHQSVVVELPELIGLVGQSSDKVKGFMSKPFDHMRELFAKKATKRKRGFVLVGTTNSKRYLTLDMGERRFLPVAIPNEVKRINTNAIHTDREQLFAEAVYRVKNGEDWYKFPKELHHEVVKDRVIKDPLIGPIREMTMGLESTGLTWSITELYRRLEGGGFIPRGLNEKVSARIEESLRQLGFTEIKDRGESRWKKDIGLSDLF